MTCCLQVEVGSVASQSVADYEVRRGIMEVLDSEVTATDIGAPHSHAPPSAGGDDSGSDYTGFSGPVSGRSLITEATEVAAASGVVNLGARPYLVNRSMPRIAVSTRAAKSQIMCCPSCRATRDYVQLPPAVRVSVMLARCSRLTQNFRLGKVKPLPREHVEGAVF